MIINKTLDNKTQLFKIPNKIFKIIIFNNRKL